MLLCNYVFLSPLVITLTLPPPSSTVAAAASLTSAIIVIVDVVVHRVPTILPILRSSLLATTRRAWRVVTPLALATVDPKEVDVASPDLQLRLRPLLRLLDRDNHDTIALHFILTSFVFYPVPRWIVMLVHGRGSARALPP